MNKDLPASFPDSFKSNDYLCFLQNENYELENNDILLLPVCDRKMKIEKKDIEVKDIEVPEEIFIEWDIFLMIANSIGLSILHDDFKDKKIEIKSSEIKKFCKEYYQINFNKKYGRNAIYLALYFREGVELKEIINQNKSNSDEIWIISFHKFNNLINNLRSENIEKYGEAFSHPWRKYLEDY